MAPQFVRYSLVAFVLLSGGVIANLTLMQPQSWSSAGRAGAQATSKPAAVKGAGTRVTKIAAKPEPVGTPEAPKLLNEAGLREAERLAQKNDRGAVSAELVRAVQRELKVKGYHPGVEDGVAGTQTRAAVMAFEADNSLPLTGKASEELLQYLVLGVSGARMTNGQSERQISLPARDVIAKVQQQLSSLGYMDGPADGQPGPRLSDAIRRFEIQSGLKPTGRVSGLLIAKLESGSERGRLAHRW